MQSGARGQLDINAPHDRYARLAIAAGTGRRCLTVFAMKAPTSISLLDERMIR